MESPPSFRRLIAGLDTVQAAYYLRPTSKGAFSFAPLMVEKERAQTSKSKQGSFVTIGSLEFLVLPRGSQSGYPLVLVHEDFTVECGELNNPAFFVTYRSKALWSQGAKALHEGFLAWAEAVGLWMVKTETLSRVDFAFDYFIPGPDFDSDSVVSLSAKDAQYRGDRKVQTIQYGKGDVVLRIYNKSVEVEEQSGKVWLYQLWGLTEGVWRIEWQVRKDILHRFDLRSFADLFDGYGDALRWLANEHESLRIPSGDSNRSRWPLHPLWADLIAQIEAFPCQGVYSALDDREAINAKLAWIGISLYGYCKRIAALVSLRDGKETLHFSDAMAELRATIDRAHEPRTWALDVEKKRLESRFPGN